MISDELRLVRGVGIDWGVCSVEALMQPQGNAQPFYQEEIWAREGRNSRNLAVIVSGTTWFWEHPLVLQLIRKHRVFRSCGNMFPTEPGALPRQFSFAVGQINGSALLARSMCLQELKHGNTFRQTPLKIEKFLWDPGNGNIPRCACCSTPSDPTISRIKLN